MLTQQGDTRVKKQDASLPYNLVLFANGDEVLSFNTLFTTRRGQYQIVLLHGCDVWLNAASSIRFSTVFSSLFCEVELTGEAYFEVFKNKKKAFQVAVGDVKIAVLRTYFNVKAYEDDTKTT